VSAIPIAPTPARTLIWRLESGGWSRREASNLVALANGLRPASTGWTVREIEHLRFLRAVVQSGRIDR
jgi:hypothetical protein